MKDLKHLKDDLKDVSKEQALMYAGAAITGAVGVAGIAFPKQFEKAVYADLPVETPARCGGRCNLQWQSAASGACMAFQALAAYEQPTARTLAVTGGMWVGTAALTGVQTWHLKAMKPETGAAIAVTQAGLGALMLARARRMKKKNEL